MAHTSILSPIKEEIEADATESRFCDTSPPLIVTPTHKKETSPQRPGIKKRHFWARRGFITRDDSGIGLSESCEDENHPYHAYENPYVRDQPNISTTVDEGILAVPPKKFRETLLERCSSELDHVQFIGTGSFGIVTKCINKSDGAVFAVKQLLVPNDKAAINEIFAFSTLELHPNIVRYYSSWTENTRIMIQIEYCERGSLKECLETEPLHETEIRPLLQDMAAALAHLHSYNLAHMDVKPENIFLCDPGADYTSSYTYKLGDMGNVTPNHPPDVVEGDCRYMARELLEDDYSQLFKADIFALGLTAYEAGGYGPLPKHGDEWHQLRSGNVPELPDLSKEINKLLQSMLHPKPLARPTASTLLQNPVLCDREFWSQKQLEQQLAMVLYQKRVMAKKLREITRCIEDGVPVNFNLLNLYEYERVQMLQPNGQFRTYQRNDHIATQQPNGNISRNPPNTHIGTQKLNGNISTYQPNGHVLTQQLKEHVRTQQPIRNVRTQKSCKNVCTHQPNKRVGTQQSNGNGRTQLPNRHVRMP